MRFFIVIFECSPFQITPKQFIVPYVYSIELFGYLILIRNAFAPEEL